MKDREYKGFIINPAPHRLTKSGRWTINLTILRHRDDKGETPEKLFSTGTTCKTKAEAIQQCIEFGKRIIDGEVEGCTVSDL